MHGYTYKYINILYIYIYVQYPALHSADNQAVHNNSAK